MASELGVQTIQHTNGTDALTIGSDGSTAIDRIQIPSFMVNSPTQSQAYTAAGSAKVQFNTVKMDSHSGWDSVNHRYTPTVAGWYLFSGAVRATFTSRPTYIAVEITKNSEDYDLTEGYVTQFQNGTAFDNGTYPANPAIIYLNGSTDYVNLCFRSQYNCTLSAHGSLHSWFCGHLVKAGA